MLLKNKKNFLLICFLISGLNAEVSTFYGATSLKEIDFSAIDVKGSLSGKKLHIKDSAVIKGASAIKKSKIGKLEVHGALHIKKSELNELLVKGSCKMKELTIETTCEIHGAVHAEKLTVKGDTIVCGSCTIEESTLKDLQYSGNDILLKDVELHNLLIKKPSNKKTQKIILKGETIIHGTITLEENRATIDAEESVTITDGIKKGENQATQTEKNSQNNQSNAGLWSRFKKWTLSLF